ncbi:hypothetical protein MRQ47_004468 [Salmonella enterica]|nr:hypothetical protein [Salmonella enterica]
MTVKTKSKIRAHHMTTAEFCELVGIGHNTFADLRKRRDFPKAYNAGRNTLTYNRKHAIALATRWLNEQIEKYPDGGRRVARYSAALERVHAAASQA